MVKALDHPVRRLILRRLHDGGEARSPRELAALLDCSVGDIVHHVAVLAEINAVALTETVFHGGSAEHFYISTVEGDGGFCLVLIATQRFDESG